MHRFYFYSIVTKPTRISNNCASLIDDIWSNIPFGVSSDHYPVFACFNYFKNSDSNLIKIKFRDFSSVNTDSFKVCCFG